MQVNLPLYPVGRKFNLAAPGTTNYIFSGATTATGFTPNEDTVAIRITANLATTGKLILGMTDGTNTITGTLNQDATLTAGVWYTFTVEARKQYSYDFKLGTDGIVNALFVSEVGGGIT